MPSRHNSFSYDPYAQHEAELTGWLPENYTDGRRPSRSHRPSTSHGQTRQDHSSMYYDPYASSYHSDYNPYSLPPVYSAPSRSHSRTRTRSRSRSRSPQRSTTDSPLYRRRTSEDRKAYWREYHQRPEVKARSKTQEAKAKHNEYNKMWSKEKRRKDRVARMKAENDELERTGRLSKWHLSRK
ncbi:hypothetical protein PMZ80_001963 [Knufia obscura]|uniref:Uncharacterized protein n=2 Tax=Knufia TaxID=430999 RepID=A0AAN8I7T9_9EURO|nr:hypothetical protein PMZ80_001963 [Knufia obscura]KAK5953781.1 hypothetical protein OHC33_005050 [Knufia fluminis]